MEKIEYQTESEAITIKTDRKSKGKFLVRVENHLITEVITPQVIGKDSEGKDVIITPEVKGQVRHNFLYFDDTPLDTTPVKTATEQRLDLIESRISSLESAVVR